MTKKKEEDFDLKWELYRKEAERRSAWGFYSAVIRAQNEEKEYEEACKLLPDKKEKELKRLKNRFNHLIIGG